MRKKTSKNLVLQSLKFNNIFCYETETHHKELVTNLILFSCFFSELVSTSIRQQVRIFKVLNCELFCVYIGNIFNLLLN